jgi:hypothetical protein
MLEITVDALTKVRFDPRFDDGAALQPGIHTARAGELEHRSSRPRRSRRPQTVPNREVLA